MRIITAKFRLLLLALGRTLFYGGFVVWSFFLIFAVCMGAHNLIQTHFVRSAENTGTVSAILSLISSVGSWVLFKSKPRSRRWVVAANLFVLFAYFPAAYWNWRVFLLFENFLWTGALLQIFGMIVFSIPDAALRHRAASAEGCNADGLCVPPLQKLTPENQTPDSQNPEGETSPVPDLNRSTGVVPWFVTRLLPTCRTLYCSMFFLMSLFMIGTVYMNIRSVLQSHTAVRGTLIGILMMCTYALVFDIVWWMSFRNKTGLKSWAIAANLILIFTWVPVLAGGSWRSFLRAEIDWWPVIAIGIVGVIIFSIPYGWDRHKPKILTA